MYLDRPRTMFDAIKLLGHEIDFEPLLIPAPTEARPGSDEKILVLRARLEAGEDLYHPDDEWISAPLEKQGKLSAVLMGLRTARTNANRDNWLATRDAKKRKANAS